MRAAAKQSKQCSQDCFVVATPRNDKKNMQGQKGIFPPQRDPAEGGTTFLIGIIIIVAVAVVLFGGVFAWQYFFVKPVATSSSAQQILNKPFPLAGEPTDQTAGPAPNGVEGWKTYTNTQYGFEFKYPSTFDSAELTPTFKQHTPPHGTDLIINGKASAFDGYITQLSLSFNVFPTRINDLEKYVKDEIASATAFHEKWNNEHPSDPINFDFTYSKITMDNTIGYAGEYKFLNSGQDNIEIFTQNSNNLIRIGYTPSNDKQAKIIQKIISTFKFIPVE